MNFDAPNFQSHDYLSHETVTSHAFIIRRLAIYIVVDFRSLPHKIGSRKARVALIEIKCAVRYTCTSLKESAGNKFGEIFIDSADANALLSRLIPRQPNGRL